MDYSIIFVQILICRTLARNYELRIMNYELWYLLTQMILEYKNIP